MANIMFPELSKMFNPNRMPSDEQIKEAGKMKEESDINSLPPVAQLEVRILQFFKKNQDLEYSPSEIVPLLNIIKDALNYPVSYVQRGSTVKTSTSSRITQIFEKNLYTPDAFLNGLIRSIGPMSGFDSDERISGRILGLWVWEHLALDIWTEVPIDKYIPHYVPDDLIQFYQSELTKKSPIVLL